MCCIGLNMRAFESAQCKIIFPFMDMSQVHVHSISNMQNCQVGQYKQVHCSICTIMNIICIHHIIKDINLVPLNIICIHCMIKEAINFFLNLCMHVEFGFSE